MNNSGIYQTFENFSSKILDFGDVVEIFKASTTRRKRYVCEIFLVIPALFIIHQWLLVAPYSEYRVLDLLWLVVRYGVAVLLCASWNFKTSVTLLTYVLCMGNITMTWLLKINYWTIQEHFNDACSKSNTVTLQNVFSRWKLVFVISCIVRAIYLWFKMIWFAYITRNRRERFGFLLFVVSFVPDSLYILEILPMFVFEISFWIQNAAMVLVMMFELVNMFQINKFLITSELETLTLKVFLNPFAAERSSYLTKIRSLQNVLKGHYEFPGKNFCRNTVVIFGIFYVSFALSYELVEQTHSAIDLISIKTILPVAASWCTSGMILLTYSALLGVVSNLCISFCYWFISTEFTVLEVFEANAGGIVEIVSIFGFIETDILFLDYNEKTNAMETVCFFSLFAVLLQTFSVLYKKVLAEVNSGASSGILFKVKVGLLIGFMCVNPCLVTYNVATALFVEFWRLFFASGNSHLVLSMLCMIVESSLIALSWRAAADVETMEEAIYYFRRVERILVLVTGLVQIYCRFTSGLFKTWWLLRLVVAILALVGRIYIFYNKEKGEVEARRKLNVLMNSLVDVSYKVEERTEFRNEDITNGEVEERHTCAICYTMISEGKMLPCVHVFHRHCVRKWFQIKFTCPLCNTPV